MFFSSKETHPTTPLFLKTRAAVIVRELLNSPLSSMCAISGFILYKSLGATPFQITIFTMLRPSVALLVLYWSTSIHSRRDKLINNLTWAGVLARVPFFIFPWVNNPWVFIYCLAVYLFFHRAETPAWVEIMKMNLPDEHRGKIYSFATALSYAEGFLLSFWVGPWLTGNESAWRWIFPLAALIGIISVLIQKKLPLSIIPSFEKRDFSNWKTKVISPWKDAINLMKDRPDFRRFQMGFFLCGFGLMMAIVVIPIYSVDVLNVSYQEITTAILVCQGFGYVLTSRVWGHQLHQVHIFKIMICVITCFVFFGIFILLTSFNLNFLYVAYFIYGIGQAGSRLCWNLSGPIFSKGENSTAYSSITILMVGIRGCIAPLLGITLCSLTNVYAVIISFICLSLLAIRVMLKGLKPSKELL